MQLSFLESLNIGLFKSFWQKIAIFSVLEIYKILLSIEIYYKEKGLFEKGTKHDRKRTCQTDV